MRLIIVADFGACAWFSVSTDADDDWVCLSIHSGIFYKHALVA